METTVVDYDRCKRTIQTVALRIPAPQTSAIVEALRKRGYAGLMLGPGLGLGQGGAWENPGGTKDEGRFSQAICDDDGTSDDTQSPARLLLKIPKMRCVVECDDTGASAEEKARLSQYRLIVLKEGITDTCTPRRV